MNKGIVFKSTGSRYLVHKENGEFMVNLEKIK